ncbi:MAG: hypothetical protein WBP10_10645 [Thermoanaerobaculia bacterium]|jgi:uncharacterized membrane protein
MKLNEAGEARVRGYLFVLGQSLKSFLPRAVVIDAVQELESHIRERIDEAEAEPDERTALEQVLKEIGMPQRVAQAYSAEITIEEAITTGRVAPTVRAFWNLATTSLLGFFPALGLLLGYLLGFASLLTALMKPIFPNNAGMMVVDGVPRGFGVFSDIPPGAEMAGGYWIIPILIALGLAILIITQRFATAFLVWWRARRGKSDVLPGWPA